MWVALSFTSTLWSKGIEKNFLWLPLAPSFKHNGFIRRPFQPSMALMPLIIIIPSILGFLLSVYMVHRQNPEPTALTLLFNSLLIIFLPYESR